MLYLLYFYLAIPALHACSHAHHRASPNNPTSSRHTMSVTMSSSATGGRRHISIACVECRRRKVRVRFHHGPF
ncbi:hypothetical protein BGZ57DRAFT_890683 [Hyaloscypha finlandica]|nr:hypothetical protein BGZ57DRAFT_890683 [Hyaloscypha finlandica]